MKPIGGSGSSMSKKLYQLLPAAWLQLQNLMAFSIGIGRISLAWGASLSLFPRLFTRWWMEGGPSTPRPRSQSAPELSPTAILKSPRLSQSLLLDHGGLMRSPRAASKGGAWPGGDGRSPFHVDWSKKEQSSIPSPQRRPFFGKRHTLRWGLLLIPLAYMLAIRSLSGRSLSVARDLPHTVGGQFQATELARDHRHLHVAGGNGNDTGNDAALWAVGHGAEAEEDALLSLPTGKSEGKSGGKTALLPAASHQALHTSGAGGGSSDDTRGRNSEDLRGGHGRAEHVQRPDFLAAPKRPKWRIVNWRKEPRTAICLVGGAREFQLTGPSIARHLLRAYKRADVFVHAPLDENAHKLSLLASEAANVVDVRIAPDVPINETLITDRLLANVRTGPAPITRQGLMQQFKGVEMCISMISAFEKKHSFQYKWVLRTRVDGYWTGPPPPLADFDRTGYTIPAGSDWGGLNDRLGVGRRGVSWLGLRRLSVLRQLAADGGYSQLNAEKTFRAQMEFLNVKVTRASFPFCILSHKKANPGFPVAVSLSSTAALNGAKCRPCVPTVTGEESAKYIEALPEKVFGPETYGVDLCEAEDDWATGWRDAFDRDAGPRAAAARQYLEGRTLEECIRDWEEFKAWVPTWDAPPGRVICMRAFLGRLHELGYPRGEWAAYLDYLTPNSTIYSMGVGEDYTFDAQLQRVVRGRIHAFDSTPAALKWIAIKTDELPTTWVHHAWILSATDGEVPVYALDVREQRFAYGVRWPKNAVMNGPPVKLEVESKRIETTMKELGHDFIDVLRIGGHISLHETLFEEWIAGKKTPPVCQVAVSFFRVDKHYGTPEGRRQLLRLREIGLELAVCIQKDRDEESCLFFSTIHCPTSLQLQGSTSS